MDKECKIDHSGEENGSCEWCNSTGDIKSNNRYYWGAVVIIILFLAVVYFFATK